MDEVWLGFISLTSSHRQKGRLEWKAKIHPKIELIIHIKQALVRNSYSHAFHCSWWSVSFTQHFRLCDDLSLRKAVITITSMIVRGIYISNTVSQTALAVSNFIFEQLYLYLRCSKMYWVSKENVNFSL